MRPSGILIHDTKHLRAYVIPFGTWDQLQIRGSDSHGFYVGFAFDHFEDGAMARRLADAINAAMRDPADDPAERAKLAAILNPPNE
jgi:hypothetical protein